MMANGGSAGVNAIKIKIVPGTRAIHRLVMVPTIPPIIRNKDPITPIEEKVMASLVPESPIIPIGKKSTNPDNVPTTNIESRNRNP